MKLTFIKVCIACVTATLAVTYQLIQEADRAPAIANVGLANNSINYSDKKDLRRIIEGTYKSIDGVKK